MAIYKARGNIAASLSNTETMIDSLRGSLAAGLHFLFLALYMLIWCPPPHTHTQKFSSNTCLARINVSTCRLRFQPRRCGLCVAVIPSLILGILMIMQ